MVSDTGSIYLHETGLDADGAALYSYIEMGGLISMSNGQQVMDIMGFIPDCQRQVGALSLTVYTKDRPNAAAIFDQATDTLAASSAISDIRVSGGHCGGR